MKFIEVNLQPNKRQLRQFGVLFLIFLPLLGWMWGAGLDVTVILGASGLFIATLGLLAPVVLKPVFIGMQIIAIPIGIVVSEVAMLLIFFGVFLPFGLVFRMAKRDVLKKSFDNSKASYWEVKSQPVDVRMYYRQS
jgi:hypothetical protein